MVDGAAKEVGHLIPGALERITVTPELQARIAQPRGQLRRGDHPCNDASTTAGEELERYSGQHDSRPRAGAGNLAQRRSRRFSKSSWRLLRKRLLRPAILPPDCSSPEARKRSPGNSSRRNWAAIHQDLLEPAAARRRHEHRPAALHLGTCRSSSSASSSARSTRTCRTATRCSRGCRRAGRREANIPPYIRPAEERAKDFGLVNQGYLGYMSLGYTRPRSRSFRLARSAARQAVRRPAVRNRLPSQARPRTKGGCPVKIHIPEMLKLLGMGRFKRGA